MSLTIEDVGKLANVSRSTVSRVLNNHPSVRDEVRQRVWQVIDEHNYIPRAAARSLASQRSKIIGLLIPRNTGVVFSDPYFPLVIQGITEASNQRDHFLMLSMMNEEMERSFHRHFLNGHHFDGIIMISNKIDDPVLSWLRKSEMPFILIGRHPYIEGINWVDVRFRMLYSSLQLR